MDLQDFNNEINSYLEDVSIILKKEQIELLYNFMNYLIEKNKVMNLTGIIEPKEIILKHFIDSFTVLKHINKNKKVIDVGTGAGFPGIPIKIAENSLDVVLMDSLNKRINFLKEFIDNNKLNKITAIHSRAEDLGKMAEYREKFDYAVSRAVAPLNILLEYMMPFVKVGGSVICMKGKMPTEEIEESKNAIRILGGKIEKIDEFVLPNSDNNRTIIIIKKMQKTPPKYPRNAGIPTKNPL